MPRIKTRIRQRRGGAILLLVVMTVSFAMLVSLTFLVSSSTSLGISAAVDDSGQSRQIAESGMAMAIAYIEQTGAWKSQATSTTLAQNMPLFGGDVTVSGYVASNSNASATINDYSFEQQTAELANTPFLTPPMSGTIGGWAVQRTALVRTGLTVPRVGTRVSATSSQGAKQAFISFGASVAGSAVFRQTLTGQLTPNTEYTVHVDITATGLPLLDRSYGFKLYAGSTVVVSSREALLLTPGLLPDQIQSLAALLLNEAHDIATIVMSVTGGPASEYKLIFHTGSAPLSGAIRLELFAESIGLGTTVTFDNVRIESRRVEPVQLTAIGRHGNAAHTITATVTPDISGGGRITRWIEP